MNLCQFPIGKENFSVGKEDLSDRQMDIHLSAVEFSGEIIIYM